MQEVKLAKLIERHGLNRARLAEFLFPMNKHAGMALSRVLTGEGCLDANQLSRLAFHLDVNIQDLYLDPGPKDIKSENGKHIISTGDYRAELDVRTWTTKVFHKDTLFHTFFFSNSSVTLDELLTRIEIEISKHK